MTRIIPSESRILDQFGYKSIEKIQRNKRGRIKDRDFPEQTIPVKACIREAIDIFYKVNASGVPLTDAIRILLCLE
ncbi:MAG: hypothetical protein LUQ63_04835 [Methanothrix sp.]|nr:hypothetical protein [Methanothrix sp.]